MPDLKLNPILRATLDHLPAGDWEAISESQASFSAHIEYDDDASVNTYMENDGRHIYVNDDDHMEVLFELDPSDEKTDTVRLATLDASDPDYFKKLDLALEAANHAIGITQAERTVELLEGLVGHAHEDEVDEIEHHIEMLTLVKDMTYITGVGEDA